MMKIIISCLPEDTEFINAAKRAFKESTSIESYTMSGVTGYDTLMLILTAANAVGAMGALIVEFVNMYMTKNKDDNVKSQRSISIEMGDKRIIKLECEGCSEETVRDIVENILGKL